MEKSGAKGVTQGNKPAQPQQQQQQQRQEEKEKEKEHEVCCVCVQGAGGLLGCL